MSDEHDIEDSKRAKLLTVAFVALSVVTLIALYLGYGPRWYQSYQPEQPIPYSHKLHAGDYKIPCLYCHSQAEYSNFSPAPGLDVCMNCHSQVKVDSPWIKMIREHYEKNEPIKWVKVHVLPDFVQFNHRAHVSAGITCQTCHGPVQEMEKVYQFAPLNMGWCMECHRNDNHLTVARTNLLNKKFEMKGEKDPQWAEWIGQKQIHNADVSCSTCHY